jgi:hypothetical protein
MEKGAGLREGEGGVQKAAVDKVENDESGI